MSDDDLLALLTELEDDAKDYVHGSLANARKMAMQEYYQQPYPDEEDDGLSKFVTSEVQDTIEWILPSLVKIFMAGENAVEFEPRKQADEDGAMQATEACNYVFYTQNDGVMVLMTALKDALMLRGGPVHWYWDEREIVEKQRFREVTRDELAFTMQELSQQGEAEIIAADELQPHVEDEWGNIIQPGLYNVQVQIRKKQGKCIVEAFEPENLLVSRDWTSPMLEKCPYVCRLRRVSLSDLAQMGYDVEAADLGNERIDSADQQMRETMSGDDSSFAGESGDPSLRTGWLRYEYVDVDVDGDGLAERRLIIRLDGKILVNEECDHTSIANGVPILRQHRWDGLSLADTMSDLQRLKTEITRMALNSMYLTVIPRARVLTDQNGVPLVNVDDMLNTAPGVNIREKVAGAYQPIEQQWLGGQVLPLIQYVDGMKENRSGVGQYFTGNTENALNKTASGTNQMVSQAQQRVELIARMLAETLVKPMFKGLFKLLTEYQIEPLSFRLRGKYVQFDPMEWRDQYDMVINVGLGNNNKDQTLMHLQTLDALMTKTAQMGVAGQNGPIVQPRHFYEVIKRVVVNMGFKQHEMFVSDPGEPNPPQQPAPPPEIVKTQMQIQADGQKQQATLQADAQKTQAAQDFEARKILDDHEHQKNMAVLQAELDAFKAQKGEVSSMRLAEHQKLLGDDSEEKRSKSTQDHDIKKTLMSARPELANDIAAGGEVVTIEKTLTQHGEALSRLLADKEAPVSIQIKKDAKGKVIGAVASKGDAQTQINIQR